MVEELIARGWEVTLLAENFGDRMDRVQEVRLVSFFRREPWAWSGKISEMLMLYRLVRKPGALVVVQGDLPRLTYVLGQFLVPLIFIRQDGILTCPGNNRRLFRSRSVCRKQAGLSCLVTHRVEGCLGGISVPHQLGRVLFRARDRILLRLIRRFVTISEYLGRVHRRSARVLYPPLRTHLERLPSDKNDRGELKWMSPDAACCSAPCQDVGRDLRRLVFCGRLEEVKGAEDAIRILSLLPQAYCLVILGEGVERERLGMLVDELRLAPRLKFLGWVDAEVRDRVLGSAGALLVTGLWDEGFGMSGIEALAQGTPAVAYDAGGISEWCRDGAGLLVRCGDVEAAAVAVRQLTEDPVQWAVHSRTALSLARLEFPVERFGRELDLLVSEAIGARASHRLKNSRQRDKLGP
jgi:glycosyltransferase involved in cell wall biosynthesis